MNGIEKEIDELGRVVIPIKIRRELGIESNSKVLVSFEDGIVKISPLIKHCLICGCIIERKQKFRLCNVCISKIKSEN